MQKHYVVVQERESGKLHHYITTLAPLSFLIRLNEEVTEGKSIKPCWVLIYSAPVTDYQFKILQRVKWISEYK
jgi:hypothetical protein